MLLVDTRHDPPIKVQGFCMISGISLALV